MEEGGGSNKNPSPSFTKYDESKFFNERKDQELSEAHQTVTDEPDYEELDPRVQDELEKLNQCTDRINDFELQLEEANAVFRTLLTGNCLQICRSLVIFFSLGAKISSK